MIDNEMFYFSHSKRNVLSLANFVQYTSNAHLLKDNETKLVGSGKLSDNTVAIPRTPHIGDGKLSIVVIEC